MVLLAACAPGVPDDAEWVVMFEDGNQVVAFAFTHVERQQGGWYQVQTRLRTCWRAGVSSHAAWNAREQRNAA